MALLSSSLTTSTASQMAESKMPAALSSSEIARRATATLAGAHGRSTTLDALTSLCTRQAPQRDDLSNSADVEMPGPAGPETPAMEGTRAPRGRSGMAAYRPDG